MEENLKIFEKKIQDTYYDLDKTQLRKMQKKMYDCAAHCCDNDTKSFDQVQSCIDTCTSPYQNAQKYVKLEFEDFQRRVERCIFVCNDNAKEVMEKNKLTDVNEKVKADYEKCAVTCLTKHMDMLPTLVFKMQDTIKHQNL